MSEALPPTSNATSAPPATPHSSQLAPPQPPTNIGAGTILRLPPNVITLPIGERLEGIVTARLANTQSVLQTRLGPVTVQSAQALPVNSQIIFTVSTAGPRPTIQLAYQPERPASPPPHTPQARLAGTAAPTLPVATRSNPAPPVPAQPAIQGLTDSQSQLRGSLVTATVVRIAAPANARSISQSTSTAALGPSPHQTALATGDRFAVRISAITRPGTGAPPASPGTASTTGTVTGTTNAGHAVVRTNSAELSLAVPRPLPVGSNLLLQATGTPISQSPPALQQSGLVLAERWETLSDILRVGASSPTPNAINQSVPQPGPQLTNTMLFFMAALRAGDLRGWLGPNAVRLIEREGLLGRISEEFGLMQRIASEPAGQDWRLFLIPVISEEQLHQMRLFIRDHGGGDQDGETPQETRFIIEVTFTKLGPFQFDGLARPKALDLIIRTEREITKHMRQSISEVFTDTTSALGLTGRIGFKKERFFEIQPLRDSGLAHDSGIVA